MIRTEIEIKGWHVIVWMAVDNIYIERIIDDVKAIGGKNLKRVRTSLDSLCKRNHGLTYTAYDFQSSVMVIGKTTSKAEFLNTLTHEICHLALHLSKYFNLNPYSEEVCYMAGDIAFALYREASLMMCDCHKDELIKEKL